MARRKFFLIDGSAFAGVEIKTLLEDAFEDEAEKAAVTLLRQVEELVKEMDANSALRGRGVYASRYNAPLNDAEVELQDLGTAHFRIVVHNPIFRKIDEGRPAINKPRGKPMRFPVYEGTMTEPNSLTINQVHVAETPKWVKTRHVEKVEPRNLLQTIINKKAYLRPPKPERRTRNPFRWRFSKQELDVKVIKVDE